VKIRPVQWHKGSAMVTIPRELVRRWHLDEVHYVVIDHDGGALRIRPLTDQELRQVPIPEAGRP